MAKLQAIAWSSRSFCVRGQHTDKRRKSARDNHVHICNFAKYSPISKKKFTDRLSNKDFLVWLLTIQWRIKCLATLRCNLSLIARFLTLMFHKVVWQHRLWRCDGSFNNHFTANLPRIFSVRKFRKSVKSWLSYNVVSLFGPPCRYGPVGADSPTGRSNSGEWGLFPNWNTL